MSDPGQPSPDRPDPPAAKGSGWGTVAKLLLILLAVGAALVVIVFGTCLLMLSR